MWYGLCVRGQSLLPKQKIPASPVDKISQEPDRLTTRSTAILLILVLLTLAGFALVSRTLVLRLTEPSHEVSPRPVQAVSSSSAKSEAFSDLNEQANRLHQISKAISESNWTEAKKQLTEFQVQSAKASDDWLKENEAAPLIQDFYTGAAVQMEKYINERNARESLLALNQMTGIIGQQQARLEKSGVSADFQRLSFLAREVELWSAGHDEQMFQVRLSAFRQSWQKVRAAMIKRNLSIQTMEGFDDLLEKLSAVKKSRAAAAHLPELRKQVAAVERTLQAGAKEMVADDEQ
jgi:hypothetical protein